MTFLTSIFVKLSLLSRTVIIAMSQSQMVKLDDNTVSRMIADKAIHDQVFRDLLLKGVSSPFSTLYPVENFEVFQVISQDIREFRQRLVDNAGLKAPDLHGKPWDLNSYLNRAANSRELVEKVNTQNEEGALVISAGGGGEWYWVVSHPACRSTCNLTLDLGITHMHCTLGCRFPRVDTPIQSRSYPIPF